MTKKRRPKSLKKVTHPGEMVSPEILAERSGHPLENIPDEVEKSKAFDINYSGDKVSYLRK